MIAILIFIKSLQHKFLDGLLKAKEKYPTLFILGPHSLLHGNRQPRLRAERKRHHARHVVQRILSARKIQTGKDVRRRVR